MGREGGERGRECTCVHASAYVCGVCVCVCVCVCVVDGRMDHSAVTSNIPWYVLDPILSIVAW